MKTIFLIPQLPAIIGSSSSDGELSYELSRLQDKFFQRQLSEANFLMVAPVVYDPLAMDSDTSSCVDFARSLATDEQSPAPAIVTIGLCSSDPIRNGMVWELKSDNDDKIDCDDYRR